MNKVFAHCANARWALLCLKLYVKLNYASLPVHYSDRLWLNLVDRVTVYEDGNLVFRFKNGMEITEML